MQLIKSNYLTACIFLLGCIGAGSFAVYLGKDLSWDLANYHYYLPYLFLKNRQTYDYWPSGYLHQYLNPAIDFLTYYLITNAPPLLTQFTMGALHGINVGILFLISKCFTQSFWVCVFLAGLGLYGPTVFTGIGSFQNDNLISVFVLLGFLTFIKVVSKKPINYILIILASLCMGLATGLKLTAGIYLLSSCISLMILPLSGKLRYKILFTTLLSVSCGMLLSGGFWFYHLWIEHQNPVYPFLNGLFKASQFPAINFKDYRFLPKTWLELFFYPFYFAWDGRIAESAFVDLRFLLVYLLFILLAIKKLFLNKISIEANSLPHYFFYSFFILSYIIWQYEFSIARYLAPLEMLAPLLIFLLIRQIFDVLTNRLVVYVICFSALFFFMQPCVTVRAPWYQTSYFNVKFPKLPLTQTTTVITAFSYLNQDLDPRPQFYLLPFFPKHWRFIGLPFQNQRYFEEPSIELNIQKFLSEKTKAYYLLASNLDMPELIQTMKRFHFTLVNTCYEITSDRQRISNLKTLLCPIAINSVHEVSISSEKSSQT